MKTSTALLLAAPLAGAAFLGGALVQHRAAKGGGASARKILHYVDPMHPAYKSDRPGIAPDCGMQLEPVYADGMAATPGAPRPAGAVDVAAEKQQLLGIRVEPAAEAAVSQVVRLYGRVAPDETRVYVLNAAIDGSIRELSPVTTGSRVRKGQKLASFFAADARGPMQAYITALDVQDRDPLARREAGIMVAAGSTASSSATFTIERLRGLGMTAEQIDEIRRTRQVPILIDIDAPADGFVLARNVSLGQKFDKGAEWYRIANLDKVWVLADAFEDDVAHVRPGLKAKLTVPGQRGTLEATVTEVLPQFDPATRTLKVRLVADNPGYALRPDMFVDVAFPVELAPALSVPADAIVDSGLRKTVYVERGPGAFEPRTIETGWRAGERVQVVRGLAAGERVVVAGTFLVDSESRMRAAASGVYGAARKDPVCGMEVDEAKARAAGKVAEHGGETWFFCSDACHARFAKDPARFAAEADRDHTALR